MSKKNYIMILFLVILDQLTKYLAISKNIVVIPNLLNITYTQNTGGAFGIGSINIITIMNILILITIALFLIKEKEKVRHFLSFTLVISGAVGNLIDRIFRGYVIDFIDVNILNFPKFNIADICITIGITSIVLAIIKRRWKNIGGEGGIRTHVPAKNRQTDFESASLWPLRYFSKKYIYYNTTKKF